MSACGSSSGSVVKKYSSRCVPSRSRTNTQRIATSTVAGCQRTGGAEEVGNGAASGGKNGSPEESQESREGRAGENGGEFSQQGQSVKGYHWHRTVLGRWLGKQVQLPMLPPRRSQKSVSVELRIPWSSRRAQRLRLN